MDRTNRVDGLLFIINRKIHTITRFFTHAQIYNGQIDFHQLCTSGRSLDGRGDIFESPSKSVKGFWEGGAWRCKIWPFPIPKDYGTLRIALPIRVIDGYFSLIKICCIIMKQISIASEIVVQWCTIL